jgi:phosphatidylglycerol:prolipoprotein diacylglycerol transferase
MNFQKITTLSIGPLDIQIWGLLVALGMLIALLLTMRNAKKKKMNSENFIDIFILVFIASIIGSRLLYVIQFWHEFSGNPVSIIQLQQGGLIFFGGLFLSALVVFAYTSYKKLSFWKVIDTIVPGLARGITIGRIGSYLIGDHIGSRTEFFLGSYYNGDLRHEPSLYLAINAFVLFIFLVLVKPFVKKEGLLSYIFIVWYAIGRFLIDFTRAADIQGLSDPRYAGLTLSQWFCIALVIIFIPFLSLKLGKSKSKS